MKSVFEKFFILLLVIVSLLYAVKTLSNQQYVHLKKVYHHRSTHGIHLELGSLVFYFAQKPIVNFLQRRRIDTTREEQVK